MDVGGFAEPRKILCQCALPSYEQISVHPRSAHGGAGIPNNYFIGSLATLKMLYGRSGSNSDYEFQDSPCIFDHAC